MLEKTVKKNLLELVFTDEFLQNVIDGLMASGHFQEAMGQLMDGRIDSAGFKRSISLKVKKYVEENVEPIIINVGGSDIIVVPSTGISDEQLERLVAAIPRENILGIIAADDVKILRIT